MRPPALDPQRRALGRPRLASAFGLWYLEVGGVGTSLDPPTFCPRLASMHGTEFTRHARCTARVSFAPKLFPQEHAP